MNFEDALGSISKDKFKQTSNRLLNQCYLLKKRDDTRMDYLYVCQNKAAFSSFFDLLGYTLKIDETQGVIGLNNTDKSCRIKLKKYDSIVLLLFRLLYAEARSSLSLNDDVVVTIEQIHAKYTMLQIKQKPILDKTILQSAISTFRKYNIIDKLDTDLSDPDTRIKIYPSILFAVPTENINIVYDSTIAKLKKYAGGDTDDEEDMQD